MTLFDRVADLPVRIEGVGLEPHERETPNFTRRTTVFALRGGGEVGYGEDVTYEADEHAALLDVPPELPEGEFTVASASEELSSIDLFPAGAPDREIYRRYRRWGVESAVLDLALKQAGTTLAGALGREYDPVRFVVSTGLGDPPTAERVRAWLDIDPDLEFKLDATPEWTPDLIDELAATDRVRILDLKGQYEGTDVDQEADPELCRRLVEAFPDALIEDPKPTDEVREALEPATERVTWDAPITDTESVDALPWGPRWLNVKPSRFGTVERLLDFVERCLDDCVRLYGGGQYELDVGREHLHALASLFYPDGPNDVAPRGYNDPEPRAGLPRSPLVPPDDPEGFRWLLDG